jgi:predicted metal-dependent phosphotriesterase family hydrolase
LIGTAVYLCLVEMKRINKQDEDSKQRQEHPGITSGVARRDVIIDDDFIVALRQNGASEDLIQKIIKQNNQVRKKMQKE